MPLIFLITSVHIVVVSGLVKEVWGKRGTDLVKKTKHTEYTLFDHLLHTLIKYKRNFVVSNIHDVG